MKLPPSAYHLIPTLTPLITKVLDPTIRPVKEAVGMKKAGLTDKAVDGLKKDRARRFDIEAPIMYRGKGEIEWHKGKSKNISRTGVMFTAEDAIPVGTEIEIHIVLNAIVEAAEPAKAGAKGVPVNCKGEVVRNILVPWPEVFPTIGAKFDNYRFGG